jgi:hypothetical protein
MDTCPSGAEAADVDDGFDSGDAITLSSLECKQTFGGVDVVKKLRTDFVGRISYLKYFSK